MVKDTLEMFKVIPLYVTRNFKITEFFASKTAETHGIVNFPRTYTALKCALQNIKALCDVLEIVRAANKGEAVFVTSGYRCVELNEKVGGLPHSRHRYGAAVDITAKDFDYLVETMEFLEFKTIEWYYDAEKRYIHIELKKYASPPPTLKPAKLRNI